jgi:hypothetical protein
MIRRPCWVCLVWQDARESFLTIKDQGQTAFLEAEVLPAQPGKK